MIVAFRTMTVCLGFASAVTAVNLAGQQTPRPEYFGFYAIDGGKLIAIADGKGDTGPTLQPVRLATLGGSQPMQRSAVRVGPNAASFYTTPRQQTRFDL